MDRDTEARIAELETLAPGWLDGLGLPLQRGVADRARLIAAALSYPPRVYPTPGGGIQFEWGGVMELEVRPEGYTVFLDDYVLTEESND